MTAAVLGVSVLSPLRHICLMRLSGPSLCVAVKGTCAVAWAP
jgi:hypothetical protein